MNARFKFRVWSSEQKKMYFWSDCVRITNFIYGMFVDHRMLGRGSWNIEQCTGLKDKNGRLIYEGDIVRQISKREPEYEEYITEVKCYVSGYPLYDEESFDYEVIGNIHENPELIEEEV